MSKDNRPLSPIELAALTAGVPCSGNDAIDDVIRLSLRVRTAQMVLQGFCSVGSYKVDGNDAVRALRVADAFMKELSSAKKAAT